MLVHLALPIIISSVAVFFTSFLSWMVIQLHRQDWGKLAREDQFLAATRSLDIAPGNYMFPSCSTAAERNSEEFRKKWKAGPRGTMTISSGDMAMGKNLVLTFLYFLVVNFCLAYLATLALKPGAEFMTVFRFVSTAALLAYLPAIVAHAIWFRCRISAHVIESVAFALIVGAICGAMWPAGILWPAA